MDSLFISELTLFNIYIINAEHMFSISERKSYFGAFCSEGGDIFLCVNHSEKSTITEPDSSPKGQHKTRKLPQTMPRKDLKGTLQQQF